MFHKLFNDDTKLFSSKLFSKSLFAVAGAFIEYLMTMSVNDDSSVQTIIDKDIKFIAVGTLTSISFDKDTSYIN